MPVEIRRVTDPQELEAIYRFRYDIYVTEMNRTQKYADHIGKKIVDPLDDSAACILGAFDGDTVVGTVRGNYFSDGRLDEYFAQFEIDPFAFDFWRSLGASSRLMVAVHHRNHLTGLRLATKLFAIASGDGITHCVIDCNPPRVAYFASLGFVTIREKAIHPEYGDVVLMVLNLSDQLQLKRANSKFSRAFDRTSPDQQRRDIGNLSFDLGSA